MAVDSVLPPKSVLCAVITEGHFTASSAFRKEVLFIQITITLRGTETKILMQLYSVTVDAVELC